MQIDYLLIERALLGVLPLNELNSEEKDFCQKYKSAFDVGLLARRMAQGYYAHTAAIDLARDPRAKTLVSTIPLGQAVPVSYVTRKDGTQHVFDFHHYLDQASTNPEVVDELPRVWLVSSLLTLGDALLDYGDNGCFDQAPVLELIYHLRNGIAHSNRFHFDRGGKTRLKGHPAHNKAAGVKSQTKAEFEIVAEREGQPVFFEFMGPGDVLDLLQSVEIYLTRIRERHAADELAGLLRQSHRRS